MTGLVHGYQVKCMNVLSQENLKDYLQMFHKLEARNLKTLMKLQLTVPWLQCSKIGNTFHLWLLCLFWIEWFANHTVGAQLLSVYTALGVRDGCCCCVLCSTLHMSSCGSVVIYMKVVIYVHVFAAWLYLLTFKLSAKILRLC